MEGGEYRLARVRILGDRPLGFVARNAVAPRNYVALVNMARRYPRPLDAAGRYLLGRGPYPARVAVRTPAGIVRPTLFSYHDMLTLNEVFCREDYRVRGAPRTVVDIGSNLGISALYFLTRHPAVRCRLYEPVARNVERLRANLAGLEDRYEVAEVAVADFAGETEFHLDPYGRYGGLEVDTPETVTVPCRHIDTVLEDALADADTIDVLKLDVEGYEARLLRAARPDLLARVRIIYAEGTLAELPVPDGFAATESCETVRLVNVRSGQGSV